MKLVENINGEIYYNGYNLKDLALKYGTPLKITMLDLIKERVVSLKNVFDKVISDLDYKGKFIYLNANKANYGALEVFEALKNADGIETSSFYDLCYSMDMMNKRSDLKNKPLVANGYKVKEYVDKIVEAKQKGYRVTDIIDSISEYEYLKSKNIELNIGLRIHLSAKYLEEGDCVLNDRFGLNRDEFLYILDDIKATRLTLTTIHFHQRGFDYEKDKFTLNFMDAFNNYYVEAKKRYNTVVNFDMGGGTPLPITNDFDYFSWAKYTIELLKNASKAANIDEPNLVSENGKYSQKDATLNVYKVIGRKYTDKYPWFIVDSSMLIALPEMYALGEPIVVKPLNGLDKKYIPARLAGVTCDCDDVFYLKDKGYIELPDIKEDLYIGCLGTGSYQNSMNGKGGVHHCLLPEEIDLVIYTDDKGNKKEFIRHNLQTVEEVEKLTGLNDIK